MRYGHDARRHRRQAKSVFAGRERAGEAFSLRKRRDKREAASSGPAGEGREEKNGAEGPIREEREEKRDWVLGEEREEKGSGSKGAGEVTELLKIQPYLDNSLRQKFTLLIRG